MNPIQFEITYTVEDLQKSFSLHLTKLYPIRSKLVLFLGAAVVMIGLALMRLGAISGQSMMQGGGYVIFGLIAIGYYIWTMKTLGKRMYKKMPGFKLAFKYSITEEGLVASTKNVNSDIKWENFLRALITDEIILLYPNKNRYNLFPKRCFTDEQFAELKELVKAKVRNVKY